MQAWERRLPAQVSVNVLNCFTKTNFLIVLSYGSRYHRDTGAFLLLVTAIRAQGRAGMRQRGKSPANGISAGGLSAQTPATAEIHERACVRRVNKRTSLCWQIL